jgi:long-subunit fatty acid transport protein
MKPTVALALSVLIEASTATAGGLTTPGAGAESTSRAGASTVAAEDGEALALNPANLASTRGTVITFGISAIDYFMSFQRNGNYDAITNDNVSYAGQRYPVMTNDVHPPLGIPGTGFQPVPLIAISSDLGNRVPGLAAAFGLYAPNGYPFRDLNKVNGQGYYSTDSSGAWKFPQFGNPPPPTRYDVIHQEATVIMPSIAVAYRIVPQLDVGARFSAGFASVQSVGASWGMPANYEENVKQDGLLTVNASDSFIPSFALAATYHASPNLELAAQYTSQIDIHAKGEAFAFDGPGVTLNSQPVELVPRTGRNSAGVPNYLCDDGGTMQKFKACIELALPQTATIGSRYKFLDGKGRVKGDVELDVDWENWGASAASDYVIVVDATVATLNMPQNGVDLKPQLIRHGFRDTYAARLGGSWMFPSGANAWTLRGGLSYDTAAAKTGWERADIDGAARTMIAAGGSYQLPRWRFDAGFGVILEGTRKDPRTCNPTVTQMGCAGTPGYTGGTPGVDNPPQNRQGPDPINPVTGGGTGGFPNNQSENPVNEGTYTSSYVLFMLGATYRF